MAEELKQGLMDIGLQGYLPGLLIAGFKDWESVSDMNESDFDALNIRLGDRRKLQREIARRQLWPENSPLPTPDEMREFTLALQDELASAQQSKNGAQHPSAALNSRFTSSTTDSSPAGDALGLNGQDLGGSATYTPGSSRNVPSLQMEDDEQEKRHQDARITPDENSTPRAVENGAHRPE